MKQTLFTSLILLSISITIAYGQGKTASSATSGAPSTAPSSAPNSIVKFDYNYKTLTPAVNPIPFDKPFYFEIDSVPTNNITKISVFAIKYHSGQGRLVDKVRKGRQDGVIRSSFELKGRDTMIGKRMIMLHLPPMRPEWDFDILIEKGLSPSNMSKALALNKILDDKKYRDLDGSKINNFKYANGTNSYKADSATLNQIHVKGKFKDIRVQLTEIKDSVNDTQYHNGTYFFTVDDDQGNTIIDTNIVIYKKYLYDPVKPVYDTLLDETSAHSQFATSEYLAPKDINNIANAITKDYTVRNRLYLLKRAQYFKDSLIWPKMLLGYVSMDYTIPVKMADPYNFDTRVKNITAVYKYLDSINNTMILIAASDTTNKYETAIKNIDEMMRALNANKKFITDHVAIIKANFNSTFGEGIWIIGGNTKSPDLQTYGTRKFTIDAGVTNIFARDNLGNTKSLTKLFLGVDYYFRSIDKNVDFNYFKPKPKITPADSNNYFLQSKKTFWTRCSLSLGVTLGGMNNKSFDNVYNTFSFTLGPSFVIWKGFKVSAGEAILKRFNGNPLMSSQERIIFAPYLSASLDYDLLGVLNNITSALFK